MTGLMLALLLAAPLDEGLKRYADLDYEGCVAKLAPVMAKLRGGPRATGELYLGLCMFALGDEASARKHLELALRVDAQLKPPPGASPKERALFDEVASLVASSPRPPPKKIVRRDPPPGEPETVEPVEEAPEPEPEPQPPPEVAETRPAEPAVVTAPPEAPPPAPRWPIVVGAGTTVVSLGLFAGFGVAGVAQRGTLEACRGMCAPSVVADVDRKFWVADVALGVAVIAAAVTVILLLTR